MPCFPQTFLLVLQVNCKHPRRYLTSFRVHKALPMSLVSFPAAPSQGFVLQPEQVTCCSWRPEALLWPGSLGPSSWELLGDRHHVLSSPYSLIYRRCLRPEREMNGWTNGSVGEYYFLLVECACHLILLRGSLTFKLTSFIKSSRGLTLRLHRSNVSKPSVSPGAAASYIFSLCLLPHWTVPSKDRPHLYVSASLVPTIRP